MDTRLVELLVCPLCKSALSFERARGDSGAFVCKADKLAFPMRDGIPLMLEAEAISTDPEPAAPPAANAAL